MNSLDPWRVILTNPSGEVIFPRPYYGHGLYQEVPSWIHYGSDDGSDGGAYRLLFDGAFIGATEPAASGISARKELDSNQVLRVEIRANGKCYRTSMDLAPAIRSILKELAQWHEGAHVQAVVGAVDAAVGEAAQALVGELIGCHAPNKVAVGAFLPLALASASGVLGGLWWGTWQANEAWNNRLRESARRGESLYWKGDDQPLFVPFKAGT